jgi:hypothetical protein
MKTIYKVLSACFFIFTIHSNAQTTIPKHLLEQIYDSYYNTIYHNNDEISRIETDKKLKYLSVVLFQVTQDTLYIGVAYIRMDYHLEYGNFSHYIKYKNGFILLRFKNIAPYNAISKNEVTMKKIHRTTYKKFKNDMIDSSKMLVGDADNIMVVSYFIPQKKIINTEFFPYLNGSINLNYYNLMRIDYDSTRYRELLSPKVILSP